MNDLIFSSFLFILGLFFGSFASVIIYRLHSGETGIFFGRSHCPKCNHILGALELIPVFSYLKNFGKCKYCKEKISSLYPILEFSFGLIFALVGYFLIDFNLILSGNFLEIFKLIFWLYISFFSMILVFYDILYFEISEIILLLLIVPLVFVLIGQTFFQDFYVIKTLSNFTNYDFSILVYSSLLAIFGIIGLYIIMLKELDLKWDFLILFMIFGALFLLKNIFGIEFFLIPILSGFIGALGIFLFFFFQIVISKGKWMGGGDLRIAIFMGLILGISYSLVGTMISYLVGSVIGIFLILYNKFFKNKKLKQDEKNFSNTEVPFGPFLVIGLFTILFFQNEIDNLIKTYFYL